MMPSVSRQSHQCLDTDGFGEYGAVFFLVLSIILVLVLTVSYVNVVQLMTTPSK